MYASDTWIKNQCRTRSFVDLIYPFKSTLIKKNNRPSSGLSSYGYDLSVGNVFLVAKRKSFFNRLTAELFPSLNRLIYKNIIIDPANIDPDIFTKVEADEILIPPRGFILAYAVEHISMPRNVSGMCIGKSTWARCATHALTTPIEAGWSGYVTIELTNFTDYPVRVCKGDGIAQLQFVISDDPCEVSYADRNGKYNEQPAMPVLPR